MIRYIDKTTNTVDKPVKSTGLLGKKMGSAPQTDTTKQEPKDKVAKLVSDIRKARICLLYTSPSPRDGLLSRMPSSA